MELWNCLPSSINNATRDGPIKQALFHKLKRNFGSNHRFINYANNLDRLVAGGQNAQIQTYIERICCMVMLNSLISSSSSNQS
jgi:hypothetical protein